MSEVKTTSPEIPEQTPAGFAPESVVLPTNGAPPRLSLIHI